MDESAIDRAKERVEQRADAAALDGVLERTRAELEALAAAAQETVAALPERVEEGLREQVLPVGRNLAEIRGLMNQVLRRLDNLEADTLGERHARVDDLALLVDLISSGWKSVDARLGRIESLVARLEEGLQERGGAIVYRIEDRRPDVANGP